MVRRLGLARLCSGHEVDWLVALTFAAVCSRARVAVCWDCSLGFLCAWRRALPGAGFEVGVDGSASAPAPGWPSVVGLQSGFLVRLAKGSALELASGSPFYEGFGDCAAADSPTSYVRWHRRK
jgi:hypothetical protein